MATAETHQKGDGAELSVTEARAGVRRGVSRILVASTLIGIAALAAAWVVAPRTAGHDMIAKPASVAATTR